MAEFALRWPAERPDSGAGAPAHPDWLDHALAVSGPAPEVARFREAARGPGRIPWAFDLDAEEARLLAPMITEGVEARLLARELREAIEANHVRAVTIAEQNRACPFDLHRLLPVPAAILALGEHDPAARAWLWANWGTAGRLRYIRVIEDRPDRRLRRSARVMIGFVSEDWSPWQALRRLRHAWPTLILVLQPRYGDG